MKKISKLFPVATPKIVKLVEKERRFMLDAAVQFADLAKASSSMSGIAEMVEKERHFILGAAGQFADLAKASSYVSVIAEQMKKEMHLLSGVKDHYALSTKASSSMSAIAEQIEKERSWFTGMVENDLSKVASGSSDMLKQFEIMGINTAEILATFENTIRTVLPGQSIAANLNVILPAINVEFTASQDTVAPKDASTKQESPTNFQYLLGMLFFLFLKSIWDGFVLPQFNDRVITPIVDSYLVSKKSSSEKEKIYGIRKLVKGGEGIDTDQSRFITGGRVNLRSGPSVKTEILTKLDFGQVVTVLSKKRDWVEVAFKYEDEVLQGWVSARYVGKFKQ